MCFSLGVELFELSTETEAEPSFFEIVFILDAKKYRYGFEANQKRVTSEWLFDVPNTNLTRLFERVTDGNSHKLKYLSKRLKAERIYPKTRSNALFLSVAAQFNVEIAERILDWLTKKVNIVSGLDDQDYLSYTVSYLKKNNVKKSEIIQLIKKLDLGIKQIRIKEAEIISIEQSSYHFKTDNSIITGHEKFGNKGNVSIKFFDLDNQESEGTKKIISIAGLLVDTLKYGRVLIFDEFDARLYPLVGKAIVELFNSKKTNFK